jgi:hypothetical protein
MAAAAPHPGRQGAQSDLFAPLYARTRIELFHSIRDGKTVWWAAAVETTPTGRPKIVDGKIAWVCGVEGPFPSSEAARRAIADRGRR